MKEVRLRGKKLVDATGISNAAIQRARYDGRLAKHKDGNTVAEVLRACKPQPKTNLPCPKSESGKKRSAAKAGRKKKTDTPPVAAPPADVSRETFAPPPMPQDLSKPKSYDELRLLHLYGQATNEILKALETSKILVRARSAAIAMSVVSREVVFSTKRFIAGNGEAWRNKARKMTETQWRDFMINESEKLFLQIGEDAVIKKFSAALDAEESARRKKRV